MAGNALLLHPDEVHDGRAGAAGGFRYRMVYIEPRLIRDALGGGVNTLPFVRRPVSSDARLVGPVASALDDLDANVEDLAADQIILSLPRRSLRSIGQFAPAHYRLRSLSRSIGLASFSTNISTAISPPQSLRRSQVSAGSRSPGTSESYSARAPIDTSSCAGSIAHDSCCVMDILSRRSPTPPVSLTRAI